MLDLRCADARTLVLTLQPLHYGSMESVEPLPHEPCTLRELVEADLRRAARLIIKIQDEIDPQFRIATPEGDYWIGVTLPPDDYERRSVFRAVSTFMAWKRSTGFTLATELYQPDSVWCTGVLRGERCQCLARIRRWPKPWTAANFGAVEWLPEQSIDPLIAGLVPDGPRALTPRKCRHANGGSENTANTRPCIFQLAKCGGV